MKKLSHMKYRLLQSKILKMNRSLPLFPGAKPEDRFSSKEILEILEFTLPQKWRSKFDLDNYVPTNHDRKRLLQECEALERNKPDETNQKNKNKKAKTDGNKPQNKTKTNTKKTS